MAGGSRSYRAGMMNFHLAGKFSATSFTSDADERKRGKTPEEENNSSDVPTDIHLFFVLPPKVQREYNTSRENLSSSFLRASEMYVCVRARHTSVRLYNYFVNSRATVDGTIV